MLQNKDEISGDPASDPSEVIKNGSSPRFPFAAKPEDPNNAGAFETASGAQEQVGPKGCAPYKQAETHNNPTSMPFLTQLAFYNRQQFYALLVIIRAFNCFCSSRKMFSSLCRQCCLPASNTNTVDKFITLRRLGRPEWDAEQP